MVRAAFTTLGCKVNQYETQRILESFERAGFQIVPFTEEAEVYVINTCSVTSQAESKSRQAVRRAARMNETAKIVVTGCAAQMALNKNESLEAADLVVPNPDKLRTFELFEERYPEMARTASQSHAPHSAPEGRTRATVKIQDGCSVYCSYCSIPYTRPKMESRSYEEVLQEARTLGRRGYKEIVLTGVLIGSYGPDTGSGGPDFEELLALLGLTDGIERLRISSIEATQVSERLVGMMRRQESKIVPHLHIPLQSGSTKVLRDMNRPYTQDNYLSLCRLLFATIPDLAISTDIMVGFPTESAADFADTVAVCEAVGFSKAHLFRFSPRYGTPADANGDPVTPAEKQERSRILCEVSNRTREAFVSRFIGRELQILAEERACASGLLRGHSENYIEVEFPGPQRLAGTICPVKIVSTEGGVAMGELSGRTRADSDNVGRLRVLH